MVKSRSLIRKTFCLVFVLLFIETLENLWCFRIFFPRAKDFSLLISLPLLKILTPPAVYLISILLLSYFAVFFYFNYVLDFFLENSNWPSLKNRHFRRWFILGNYYFFLNFIYGLNSFLFFGSAFKHFLLYLLPFPRVPHTWFLFLLGFYFLALFLFTAKLAARKKGFFVLTLPLLCVLVILSLDSLAGQTRLRPFTQKNNVILLGVDSIQYNRLTKNWGFHKDLAPNIGDFLERSVCFTNSWSPLARTYPSYNAILTGRYPINNGIRDNLLEDYHINPTNLYLGNLLKEHNYFSSHYTDEVRFSIIRNIHGFDKLFHPKMGVTDYILATFFDYAITNLMLYTNFGNYLLYPLAYNRSHVAYNPRVFVNRVIKEINNLPRDKPQFIVIHLCSNHYPYFPAFPYNRNRNLIDFSEKGIAMTDGQVGQLLEFFKKSQLLENSLFVLHSDHGDGWDAVNKAISHGSNFNYLWCNKTVLGFWGKGYIPRKIDNLVRSFDIYPTILEMMGLEVPKDIDGISLVNLMDGRKEAPRNFFAETGYSLENKYINGKIQNLDSDIKNYKVDYKTGLAFIKDEDYDEWVLKRKWYLMINKNLALIYNPFLGEVRFGFIDPLNPQYFLTTTASEHKLKKGMLIQIKKFNKIK
ncbi:MAG: hypothetical protein FJZ10_00725 [Candidatus Omnitrophica bacterium]|nr:hypothetical protein [Candidatus Omnitrophota bacterium]